MRSSLRRLARAALRAALLAPLAAASLYAQEAAQPPVIPETTVEAAQPATATIEDDGLTGTILDGTIFTSPEVIGYRAESSTTGTIIDIPDADLPATVNVIPRDVIDDQIALSFTDIARNAPGVVVVSESLFADQIYLRGLRVGTRNYRKDGFLDPTFVPRDFQNVERVEILKGPASILYGAGDPAGLVNVITKKPVSDCFAVGAFTFGAYQQERITADVNGFATSSGNVLYRLNAAQEDANSFRDFGYLSRTQIAPVVTWLISPSTTLTWNTEWHRDKRRNDPGIPAIGADALALPQDRYVGEPSSDFFDSWEFRQSLVLTHEINDCWWFSLGGSSLFYDFPNSTSAASDNLGFLPPVPPPLFYRSQSTFTVEDEQSQSMIANLAGEFWTGPLLHKAVVGMEYNYFDSASAFTVNPLPPINAAAPVYTNPPPLTPIPLVAFDAPVFRQQRVGGYVQDLIEINPYWKALAGVRFDTLDFDFDRTVTIFGAPQALDTDQHFSRTSPRAGLVYQPWADDDLALYYSYSESFTPPGGGLYVDAGPILPVLGQSHEAGIKAELLPDLSLVACGFHAERDNDTFFFGPALLDQVGSIRSQGAEVSLIGDITDRWSVIANYTYTDTLVTDDDPLIDGRRARNVPYNTANLWTRFNVQHDECQTVGAALGVVYVGERLASQQAPDPVTQPGAPDVLLPGYTRWDAGLYLSRGRFYSAVYLENIFDIEYAVGSIDEFQIFPGAPINARATAGWVF
jgi:iron complex outermembrane receptor protein